MLLARSSNVLRMLKKSIWALLEQVKGWSDARTQQPQPSVVKEGMVPGLIVVGFAPTISRQEGVQQIMALGLKPMRYKAAANLYQVAVPPGQEQALIRRFLRQPGVVSAALEPSSAHPK